jgi:CRISPR-associated protein Csd1
MFLQSLYEFAKRTKARHGKTLLESPEFNSRYISWLIDIKSDGQFLGLIPLMTEEAPGDFYGKLPRTVEAKDSGTVAEFLVEDVSTIFGLGEVSGKPMKDKARAKHENYWSRIESAVKDLEHPALQAILLWRQKVSQGIPLSNPVYELYQKPGGRSQPKDQWLAITPTGEKLPLYFRPNVSIDATFRVDGQVTVLDEEVLDWWRRWFENWIKERENACWAAHGHGRVCVLSGDDDAPLSNSHLPKIKGRRIIQSFGATLASAEGASFHSYGLSEPKGNMPGIKKGPDASYTNISVKAAIAYCNALNYLLESDDHHTVLGPIGVCTWEKTNEVPDAPKQFKSLLSKAHPEMVNAFLRAPFAGIADREVLRRDRLYTVALAGNAGRVVVYHWLDQTLNQAIVSFKRWWEDVQIVSLYPSSKNAKDGDKPPSPFAIPNLARTTLRRTKGQKDDKLMGARIVQLYRTAIEGTSLPITMLKPILDEFHSTLVKNDEKKPTYPYSQSRFALIKMILIRNRKEDEFMPEYKLADTNDSAYNLGCLFAVLEALQRRSRRTGREGPERSADRLNAGIIERYYGQASTAPALAFPYLLSLSRHHLSKLRKGNEKDKNAAGAIEQTMVNICKKFKPNPEERGEPPKFPRLLDLEHQGRFALGFYQQKAYDIAQARKYKESQGKEGLDIADNDEFEETNDESLE